METSKLKRYAQFARRNLIEQVSAKLNLILGENSTARRESVKAVTALEEAISKNGLEHVVERVAYIWFNRFCALRFMDVNRYTRIGVVSPAEGQFQPEILSEAKMGHIDETLVSEKFRQQVFLLLDDKTPSKDPQGEAYRLLIVAACNYWNKAMPFLFQRIDDYTELLMPDDLLSGNSILAYTREAMTPDVCKDVEVIGWLYQFYISEKKDEVFAGLKKNKKITPDNIPAATQLFTPHWIVRYLVENSLGRLWMLNRPDSRLVEQMDYYLKPDQPETDFLQIAKPEEIKICDPACGSGHMLTYAFDLLYSIYEEEGYGPAEIPEKILKNNLYGIEIDERAGELAAFALTMKARSKQRRFFNKGVEPNICVLQNVEFNDAELKSYMDFIGHDLFSLPLQTSLSLFRDATNLGSLIKPSIKDACKILRLLESKNVSGQLFLSDTHQKVIRALSQADYLSQKYHVVVANPPYMGAKGMNEHLGAWAKDNYPNSKSDLFALFIERNLNLVQKRGVVAMITMQSWMFLSSFESLRELILNQNTLLSMAHLGARAFDSIGGEVVSTSAFVLKNNRDPIYKGDYLRLVDGKSEAEKESAIRMAINNQNCDWIFRSSAVDFEKIPGSPIVYWVSENTRTAFVKNKSLASYAFSDGKNITGNNNKYQRFFWEVSLSSVGSSCRWVFISKGGGFKRWIENKDITIDWSREARTHYRKNSIGRIIPEYIWFREGITWGLISTSLPSFKMLSDQFTFSDVGVFFHQNEHIPSVLAFLNSKVAYHFLSLLNPTINYPMETILKLPVSIIIGHKYASDLSNKIVEINQQGILTSENSRDFSRLPLLNTKYHQSSLKATYQILRSQWREMMLEVQRLEEKNNRIFIDAYGLQDELMPEVPLKEITLTCNPNYRYGNDKSKEELEALLLADTMRELVSYSVGCMFGRYSLNKSGLILANQGETIEDYLRLIPEPTFHADDDNVIPMLDGNWFTDDIVERFKTFLRSAFGDEHYRENLEFVEKGLNIKNKRNYSIRDYFLKEFYADHLKRYKKRPIYWLFSSPKGTFNALIYMHRYRPDTASVVLNGYLREFRTKLTSHKGHLEAVSISGSASQSEKTKALKEVEKINKMLVELEEYEHATLYPLATKKVEIDLDDGVKVNYAKFGKALKKVPGLSAK